MMRKLHPLVIVGLFAALIGPLAGRAQTTGLALSMVNYTVQPVQGDTGEVNLGYTITINAYITNNTQTSFSGSLDFGLRNSQQQLTGNTDIFNKPPYSGNQVTLKPGETVPAIFSVDINSPYFIPGPDVVVVWPISSQPIADSIRINLQIIGPNDVTEDDGTEFSYLALNDKILLQTPAPETGFQQVRIFDLAGQEVLRVSGGNITEIPTITLNKGLYLCEITLADNKRKVIKFVR